ncbi:MAG: hypothetical protein LQ339_002048 [Xanthoria mediterranea]|nr:MAG: hypothetical protein LQ339_002048 [Xanthoria mediterranea]
MYPVYAEQIEHSRDGQAAYKLPALVPSEEVELLCPIRYIYNYLPVQPNWLETRQLSLRRFCEAEEEKRQDSNSRRAEPTNSITMNPRAANLPLHTGLDTTFRQSRYWKSNERSTEELLKLFAEDERCSSILCSNKQSMSSLAEEQRRCAVMDTYSRFSTYMFPQADASRAPLLAQYLWENASPEIVFLSAMENK